MICWILSKSPHYCWWTNFDLHQPWWGVTEEINAELGFDIPDVGSFSQQHLTMHPGKNNFLKPKMEVDGRCFSKFNWVSFWGFHVRSLPNILACLGATASKYFLETGRWGLEILPKYENLGHCYRVGFLDGIFGTRILGHSPYGPPQGAVMGDVEAPRGAILQPLRVETPPVGGCCYINEEYVIIGTYATMMSWYTSSNILVVPVVPTRPFFVRNLLNSIHCSWVLSRKKSLPFHFQPKLPSQNIP